MFSQRVVVTGLGAITSIKNTKECLNAREANPETRHPYGRPQHPKQYLKIGGKVLAFNLDPHFGDTLDGLMVVDLTRTDHKVLKRYMGTEGFEGFKTYQSGDDCARFRHTGKPVPFYAHA
ncbi:MAG: hypothetical protein R6U38_02145 [Desulfatiglandaceae bacterium]